MRLGRWITKPKAKNRIKIVKIFQNWYNNMM